MFLLLAMVIIGGRQSILGCVVGALGCPCCARR
jgi:ABC-type branched-subunit amino acid transport system permease subunit